jgi:hypothetical protein
MKNQDRKIVLLEHNTFCLMVLMGRRQELTVAGLAEKPEIFKLNCSP